ncbi:MAG: fibronectin type III domain-containing protein, partial [Verrucomicrobiota bacterium]
ATDRVLDFLLAEHRVPDAPKQVGASDGLFSNRIRVGWEAGGNYPVRFALYRGDSDDPGKATLIAGDLPKTASLHVDTDVEAGKEYHYWLKAWNRWGWSDFSAVAKGQVGEGMSAAKAHEPFDYDGGSAIDGQTGGEGFASAWKLLSENGTIKIDGKGLSYPGVSSSGGALRVICENQESLQLDRNFKGTVGRSLEEVWMSFLVRGEKVADGHVFVGMNTGGGIGKAWTNGFGVTNNASRQMKPEETYFAVAKYDCRDGADRIYFWLNPALDAEPATADADTLSIQEDLGLGNRFGINVQGHGSGEYVFDEIRIGTSWDDVSGQ